MKVSEIAKKFGLKATELVSHLEELGLSGYSPGTLVPDPELKKVKKLLKEKGFSEVNDGKKVTLIKKKKSEEAKPVKKVALVKKKIVIKRKHVHVVKKEAAVSSKESDNKAKSFKKPGTAPTPPTINASPARGREKDRKHGERHDKTNPREKEFELQRHQKKQEAHDNVPKEIEIMETVPIGALAKKMNLKANEIIAKLMGMGVMATINQQIDSDTASLVAAEFGCNVKTISLYEETLIEEEADNEKDMIPRPPIVTIMGHVDHGKTKLLDTIRSENVVASESGGITQHIGAYQVETGHGKITFLDTPGHEAFSMMRARGASITDIVVLVVAADDGIMPQTVEAINHAKDADTPIIVAINKIDRKEANIDKVKQQLADKDLLPEDWGGKVMCVPVSALKNEGIDNLLEAILLESEILESKANPKKVASGVVLEARVDQGKGTVATIICRNGTINIGDNFVAGVFYGKVRAMFNDSGKNMQEALPAMPVELLGSSGIPKAGDPFHIVESDKKAKQISAKRQELRRFEDAKNVKKVTMDNLFEKIKAGEMKELKVVIKADVQGSAEALRDSLEKIKNEEVRLVCIHHSAGAINESDVMLASASNAILIGFHVRPSVRAKEVADAEKVEIKRYSVIYDAINDLKAALVGMMAPDLLEQITGSAEVRDTFKVPKIGVIAGCYVTEGSIQRGNSVRVIREGVEIYDGKLASLKRFKDDAKEVQQGFECGIGIENYNDIKVEDILESYYIKEVAKSLV